MNLDDFMNSEFEFEQNRSFILNENPLKGEFSVAYDTSRLELDEKRYTSCYVDCHPWIYVSGYKEACEIEFLRMYKQNLNFHQINSADIQKVTSSVTFYDTTDLPLACYPNDFYQQVHTIGNNVYVHIDRKKEVEEYYNLRYPTKKFKQNIFTRLKVKLAVYIDDRKPHWEDK